MVSAALSTAECRWICELNFNFPLLFWRLQQSAHWSGGGRKESLSQGPLAPQWAAICPSLESYIIQLMLPGDQRR